MTNVETNVIKTGLCHVRYPSLRESTRPAGKSWIRVKSTITTNGKMIMAVGDPATSLPAAGRSKIGQMSIYSVRMSIPFPIPLWESNAVHQSNLGAIYFLTH